MNHKLLTALLAALVASVALAGCTDGDSPKDPADAIDPDSLQAGKGAIKGLLVDDRYRPIQLVDGKPISEFQAEGFILIQETAEQIHSNENGEFQVVNLAPGTYTLRVQSDNHEAKVVTIEVPVGVFAEVTVEARRIASEGSFILTQESSVYIPCAADYIVNGGVYGCDADLSGDGYSAAFYSDYSQYGDGVTFMIVEMLANQERGWEIQVRDDTDDEIDVEFPYFMAELSSGDYVRMQMERGVNADDHQDNIGYEGLYGPWDNLGTFETVLFVDHQYRDETQGVTGSLTCCGVGVSLGVKAKFLQSVFLGPPEVDIDSYCVLCE